MFTDINGDGKLTNAGADQYLLGKKMPMVILLQMEMWCF